MRLSRPGLTIACWASAALMLPAAAQGCSRPVPVAVASLGLSVTVGDEGIGGVYPDILRGLSGCSFEFTVVPRARQQVMFETGRSALLVPASRTPQRDEWGHFVPLIQARATLVSLAGEVPRAPLRSLQELRERRELRVSVVRGFDYGEPYQALLRELREQGRVSYEANPASVARALATGLADLTIMAPSILIGSMHTDPRVRPLLERVRSEPVDELPWSDSGVYISRSAVGEADRLALTAALERAARSGAVWKAFQRYYPPGSLTDSIRPRRD